MKIETHLYYYKIQLLSTIGQWLILFSYFYFEALPSIVEDRIVSSLSLPPVGDSVIINQHNDDSKLLPLDSKNLPNQQHSMDKETGTGDPNVQDVGSSSSCESSESSRDSDGEKETNSNADELQRYVYVTNITRCGQDGQLVI